MASEAKKHKEEDEEGETQDSVVFALSYDNKDYGQMRYKEQAIVTADLIHFWELAQKKWGFRCPLDRKFYHTETQVWVSSKCHKMDTRFMEMVKSLVETEYDDLKEVFLTTASEQRKYAFNLANCDNDECECDNGNDCEAIKLLEWMKLPKETPVVQLAFSDKQ